MDCERFDFLLVILKRVVTDPSREESGCSSGVECILGILRALKMGSCFSAESRSPHPNSPNSSSFRKSKSNSKKRLGSRTSSFEYWRNDVNCV